MTPVVCLTVPKSGTHLLMNIMREIIGRERVRDSFITGEELARGAPLDERVYVGHVPHSWRAHVALRRARTIALFRDPRDVVTSLAMAHFKRKVPNDALSTLIQSQGLSFSEVIDLVMLGDHGSEQFPSVVELFERYHLQWRGSADAVVSYEQLLAARSDEGARETLRGSLSTVLGTDLDSACFAQCLEHGSDPAHSATFERGQAGTWAEIWTSQNAETFRSIAPHLLQRLGYEGGPKANLAGMSVHLASVAKPSAIQSGPSSAILGELEALKGKVERIRSLDDHVPQRTVFISVPELKLGLFCWADDSFHSGWGYVQASDEDLEEFVTAEVGGRWATAIPPGGRIQPLLELITPHLEGGGRVHVVDVGCQYGGEAILIARELACHGDRLQVTALDPGIAGRLVPWNLRLNSLANRVRYLPVGASNRCGIDLVYGEYGHSENCRTVTRVVATETFSYPCEVTTLDELLGDAPKDQALFVKLDIQGGEWNALAGAQRVLRERRVLGLMTKFVPSVARTFGDPAHFIDLLPDRWTLYALPYYQLVANHVGWVHIRRDRFPDYASALDRSRPGAFALLVAVPDGTTPPVPTRQYDVGTPPDRFGVPPSAPS